MADKQARAAAMRVVFIITVTRSEWGREECKRPERIDKEPEKNIYSEGKQAAIYHISFSLGRKLLSPRFLGVKIVLRWNGSTEKERCRERLLVLYIAGK